MLLGMIDQRFPKRFRLRSREDFRRVFERKRSVVDSLLVAYGCRSGFPYPRVGLAVSRKIGSAVVRNRWKRLLREAFRLTRDQLPPGLDLVLVPRAGAKPELASLVGSLPRLAHQLARRLARDTA
jgi:ribonuclease P protein component